MDHRIPEPLKALVEQLARLPGLGPKSAMRVAMTLLKWPEAETRRLGKGIHDLRDNLRLCSRCGALTETDPCNVCSDRNATTRCCAWSRNGTVCSRWKKARSTRAATLFWEACWLRSIT